MVILILVLSVLMPGCSQTEIPSVFLEDLTWEEAEKALKQYKVVLIALGARTKEHSKI